MELIATIDKAALADARLVAESDEFAVYAREGNSYLIVHRHAGTTWQALEISGDGVFRLGELVSAAMRDLYRTVALRLAPKQLDGNGSRK